MRGTYHLDVVSYGLRVTSAEPASTSTSLSFATSSSTNPLASDVIQRETVASARTPGEPGSIVSRSAARITCDASTGLRVFFTDAAPVPLDDGAVDADRLKYQEARNAPSRGWEVNVPPITWQLSRSRCAAVPIRDVGFGSGYRIRSAGEVTTRRSEWTARAWIVCGEEGGEDATSNGSLCLRQEAGKGKASIDLRTTERTSCESRDESVVMREETARVANARRERRRISKAERITLIVVAHPPASDFLSAVPADTRLGDIALPGTHESCALYGYPISQCQQPTTSIAQQLLDGVRFIDVRLKVVGDELQMYHGIRHQRSTFPLLLATLDAFLTSHPSETVIVCIKEETPPFHPLFSRLLHDALLPFIAQGKWFLSNRVPRLGEVRGKAVLMSRFDEADGWEKEEGRGVWPYTWPDSRKGGFEWNCDGTRFRIQDWYRISTLLSIPEKFAMLKSHIQSTLTSRPLGPPSGIDPTFTLSFASAASFPLALPTTVAKGLGWPPYFGVSGVNDRLATYLVHRLEQGQRVRACVLTDFYRQSVGGSVVDLIVAMNFVGVDEK